MLALLCHNHLLVRQLGHPSGPSDLQFLSFDVGKVTTAEVQGEEWMRSRELSQLRATADGSLSCST